MFPGRYFYLQNPQPNTLRLGFAGLDEKRIARGVETLGEVLKIELRKRQRGGANQLRVAWSSYTGHEPWSLRTGFTATRPAVGGLTAAETTGAGRRMLLKPNPTNSCFGCGGANPRGMLLTFEQDDATQRIRGDFRLGAEYQGGGGFIHGGIIALVLDEVMGKVSRFRERSRGDGGTDHRIL